MPHAILLPTRGPVKYRGKHPTRARMISSCGTHTSVHEAYIGMKKPYFIELNDGRRFYIEASHMMKFSGPVRPPSLKFDFTPMIEGAHDMSQEAYEAMLADLKEEQTYRAKAEKRVKYRQEGGDDGYCYVVRVDGHVRWTGLTRREAGYYKDKEVDNLMTLRNR